MKISVIMASFLGDYPGNNSPNKPKKFIRAVNSFIKQTHEDKELIIISDGCEITSNLVEEHFSKNPMIKLFKSVKLPMYHGQIRTIGLRLATGDLICYLDNDDYLGKNHLKTISEQFKEDDDFVYYDDFLVLNKEFTKFQRRVVLPRYGSIGTSSIAHKNRPDLEWFNGYGHDFLYVLRMSAIGMKYRKLEKTPEYIVAHYKNADF